MKIHDRVIQGGVKRGGGGIFNKGQCSLTRNNKTIKINFEGYSKIYLLLLQVNFSENTQTNVQRVKMRGDCPFCCFVDIGGIVDHLALVFFLS